jgi:hypothetical protein
MENPLIKWPPSITDSDKQIIPIGLAKETPKYQQKN